MAAIETHALRKVYPAPAPPRRRGRGAPGPGTGAPGLAPGGRAGVARGEILALQGLDLAVDEGEFFGLLGPNGAGKTTTIGILTTRVKPTSGTALVGGADVARQDVSVRQRIGVVPQRPNPDRAAVLLPVARIVMGPIAALTLTHLGQVVLVVLLGVYVAEGMRGALTPSVPHMPLGIVGAALVVIVVLFWTPGIRSFYKRAIG